MGSSALRRRRVAPSRRFDRPCYSENILPMQVPRARIWIFCAYILVCASAGGTTPGFSRKFVHGFQSMQSPDKRIPYFSRFCSSPRKHPPGSFRLRVVTCIATDIRLNGASAPQMVIVENKVLAAIGNPHSCGIPVRTSCITESSLCDDDEAFCQGMKDARKASRASASAISGAS